jgi:hypothetical protein
MSWEYTTISWSSQKRPQELDLMMNAYGSVDWELVAIDTQVSTTSGPRILTLMFKRQTVSLAAPDGPPEWFGDPLGRHHRRYWDGLRWTEHVLAIDSTASIDFPVK